MTLPELLVVATGAYCLGWIRGHSSGVKEAIAKLGPSIHSLKRSADQQLRLVSRRP